MGKFDHVLQRMQFHYSVSPGGNHTLTTSFKGHSSDEETGHLYWGGENHEIEHIQTNEHLTGMGVATHMYNHAKKLDPQIKHSPRRTDAGERWARSTGDKLPKREKVYGED